MLFKEFSFQTDTETLSAFQVNSQDQDTPTCLLLHGAGKSDKERLRPIAWEFAKLGISSIGFDFSGAGSSTNNIPNSIAKRVQEAEAAIAFLDPKKNIILCGFSMSGQVVINLLQKYTNISHIVFFAPWLYDIRALDIPFWTEFTNILREPESWRNNNTKEILGNFTGKILIVMGSDDDIIPSDIPGIILANAIQAEKKEIHIIKWAPHMLAWWTQENPENARYIGDLLVKFLQS